jgi:hypothetical protein
VLNQLLLCCALLHVGHKQNLGAGWGWAWILGFLPQAILLGPTHAPTILNTCGASDSSSSSCSVIERFESQGVQIMQNLHQDDTPAMPLKASSCVHLHILPRCDRQQCRCVDMYLIRCHRQCCPLLQLWRCQTARCQLLWQQCAEGLRECQAPLQHTQTPTHRCHALSTTPWLVPFACPSLSQIFPPIQWHSSIYEQQILFASWSLKCLKTRKKGLS